MPVLKPETPATALLRQYNAAVKAGDHEARFRIASDLRRYGIRLAAKLPTARALSPAQPHPGFARPPAG